jgi:hypothetical protein
VRLVGLIYELKTDFAIGEGITLLIGEKEL